MRAPATGPGSKIGPVYVNFGGPGGPGVGPVKQLAATRLARLRERFDVVSFDPRGVGANAGGESTPDIVCDFAPPPAPAPGDPASRAQYLDAFSQLFTDACLAQTGPVVTKMTTNNTARDLDRLRAALGVGKLTYHGVSYGSDLGAVYASLFPHRVRAMILDGGVFDTFRDYTIEAFLEEAAMHELALARVDQLCRRDPACPLKGRGVVDAADEILGKLRANPLPAPGGALLTARDAAIVLTAPLFNDRNRTGRIPALLVEALAGNYARWLPLAGATSEAIDPASAAYAAVFCNDLGPRRPAADFLPLLEAAESLYPRIGKYAELEIAFRTCQKWPTADLPIFRNVAGKVSTPILLIANDFDPATPIAWTRHLAHALGMEASLLRYQGIGHTATTLAVGPGVPCIDDHAMEYLIALKVPPAGTSCPALPITWQAPQ